MKRDVLGRDLGTGLGRGLEFLMSGSVDEPVSEGSVKLHEIDIDLINVNLSQPRKFFDDDSIGALAESIRNHGVVQPLIVSATDEGYIIVAGERRYRAAKLLELKSLPCIVIERSDRELLEISLIENIQREDLNPIEEAHAFKKLIDDFNMTQELLADKISISRAAVTNKLRLLKLPSIVQEYIINSDISESHAKILIGLKDDKLQIEIANKIIDEGLNVRQTEKLIKFVLSNEVPAPVSLKLNNPYIADVKLKLEDFFGTKISINDKKNKGSIKIEYYSDEDLSRILSLMGIDNKN